MCEAEHPDIVRKKRRINREEIEGSKNDKKVVRNTEGGFCVEAPKNTKGSH